MPQKFSQSMKSLGFDGREHIAVAVSGGGDSMALALLLSEFMREKDGRLLALTVDHRLRPESAGETQRVREILKTLGIEHRILTWTGEKPQTHIQERAREARYHLLLEECQKEKIPFLAVAHNAEDCIETFWMRLSHGSGLDGLAGMAAKRNAGGVDIIRPLLSFNRAELRDICREKSMAWIEDPSNSNHKYLRVKLRAFEDVLAQEGLTQERLSATQRKLEGAREALNFFAKEAFSKFVTVHAEGYLSLDAQALKAYPVDIRRRVIEKSLSFFSGGDYPPSFDALDALSSDMQDAKFSGRTLAGCDMFSSGKKIIFCREEAAVEGRKKIREGTVWDGRFSLSGFSPPGFSDESLEAGALGEAGIADLRKKSGKQPHFESLDFKVKKTLLALWRGENLLSVPHVSWQAPEAPEALKKVRADFRLPVKIV